MSLTAAVAAQGSATAAAPSTAYGLKLLPAVATVPQLDDALYAALGDAERLTEKNPNDYGYAWADRSSGQVVIDVVTPHGRVVAAAAIAALAGPAAAHKPVLRATSKSRAALEQLKHDVIDLAPAGAFSSVDPATSEVVLTVPALTQSLATAITSRYGTDSVSVRVDSTIVVPTLQIGRQNDTSTGGFYGGSLIYVPGGGACSDAFSWYDSSYKYMLSAGHCFANGGTGSTPGETLGTVTSGSRESYNNGVGSVYMTGQSTYRGDISLIQLPSGKTSAGRIYRGSSTSTSSSAVGEMWSRRAAQGDQYCTGGAFSGENCGWVVQAAGIDMVVGDGNGGTVTERNIVRGTKGGTCTTGGDSGGSVFTVRPDGKIAAKGIHDFGTGGSGSCVEGFTDIYEAYYGFPGLLTTS